MGSAGRGDRKPRVVVNTPFAERYPRLSPDGRWLAYTSDEAGRQEVFVQPFPGPGGAAGFDRWRYRASVVPRWTRAVLHQWGQDDGRRHYAGAGIPGGDSIAPLRGAIPPSPNAVAAYDVSADGQRFLRVQPMHPDPPANQIQVVLNSFQELRRNTPGP